MLPFVPRKVAQSIKSKTVTSKHVQNVPRLPESSSHADAEAQPSPEEVAGPSLTSKGKTKDTHVPQPPYKDYATLLVLSLTEYALWINPDLRRNIETSDEGYIPLSYLVTESPYFFGPDTLPLETALVKAVRMYAAERFDVRMLMSEPTRAVWYGRRLDSQNTGGYEIRLKHAESVLNRVKEYPQRTWDATTLYVENIPPQYRSIEGIYHLISSLLPESTSPNQASHVQNISLPRHHQDKPGDQPKCKGFALVTLFSADDVHSLLERWPWRRDHKSRSNTQEQPSTEWSEAAKFGFRVLPKSQWDKLNEEYLAYRQRLLDEIAREEEQATPSVEPVLEPVTESTRKAETSPPEVTQMPELADLTAPFPRNCLVFVRNVHPETNKTTLRKLFSQALQASGMEAPEGAIDYVDFNKGMTTCYLRLSSPQYTQQLASYFSDNDIAQTAGLDTDGGVPSAGSKAIATEIVTNEREELYWGKVPEKVRRQAVAKAVMGPSHQSEEQKTQAEGGPRRKRRRG